MLVKRPAVVLRVAQKEAKEAGGRERERERRRPAASVGGTLEPGANGAASMPVPSAGVSREQAQQLLSAVQRRGRMVHRPKGQMAAG